MTHFLFKKKIYVHTHTQIFSRSLHWKCLAGYNNKLSKTSTSYVRVLSVNALASPGKWLVLGPGQEVSMMCLEQGSYQNY